MIEVKFNGYGIYKHVEKWLHTNGLEFRYVRHAGEAYTGLDYQIPWCKFV